MVLQIPATTSSQQRLKNTVSQSNQQPQKTVAPPLFAEPAQEEDKSLLEKVRDRTQAMEAQDPVAPWLSLGKKIGGALAPIGEKALEAITSIPAPDPVKQAASRVGRGLELGIVRPIQTVGAIAGPVVGPAAQYAPAISPSYALGISKRITREGYGAELERIKDVAIRRQKGDKVLSLAQQLLSGEISPRKFAGQLIEIQESKDFWDQMISELPVDFIPVGVAMKTLKSPGVIANQARRITGEVLVRTPTVATGETGVAGALERVSFAAQRKGVELISGRKIPRVAGGSGTFSPWTARKNQRVTYDGTPRRVTNVNRKTGEVTLEQNYR